METERLTGRAPAFLRPSGRHKRTPAAAVCRRGRGRTGVRPRDAVPHSVPTR